MKKKDNNAGVLQCPSCGSRNILTRRNGESWCRRCGWSGEIINVKRKGHPKRLS